MEYMRSTVSNTSNTWDPRHGIHEIHHPDEIRELAEGESVMRALARL